MEIMVVGAGAMGSAICYFLSKLVNPINLTIVDCEFSQLKITWKKVHNSNQKCSTTIFQHDLSENEHYTSLLKA